MTPEEDPNPGNLTLRDLRDMSKDELRSVARDVKIDPNQRRTELLPKVAEKLGLNDVGTHR